MEDNLGSSLIELQQTKAQAANYTLEVSKKFSAMCTDCKFWSCTSCEQTGIFYNGNRVLRKARAVGVGE
jgi:hypothetical protein